MGLKLDFTFNYELNINKRNVKFNIMVECPRKILQNESLIINFNLFLLLNNSKYPDNEKSSKRRSRRKFERQYSK